MKSKSSQRKLFMRIITTPIRALSKARDLYVKSLSDYGDRDRMNLGNVMAAAQGTSHVSGLPKSFSVNSARSTKNEDLPELSRAASARSTGDIVGSGGGPRAMPPRSSSVAMGRIDEDRPYINFCDQDIINSGKNGIMYPRSRSHAVTYSRRLI